VDVVDGPDGRAVHQLQRHGHETRGRETGHGGARRLERREEREQRGPRGWGDPEPQRGLRHEAEGPLAADEQRHETVSGHVLEVLAAKPHHRAIRHDDLEPQDGVARHAVLHAAQPARVRPEVAADGAGLVGGRVRRVEQAPLRDGRLEVRVQDTGLRRDGEVPGVDLEHAVHARERDGERTLDPRRAAGETGPRAPRHDRHVVIAAEPDELRDLRRLHGERDRQRQACGKVRRLVSPVRLAVERVGQQAEIRQAGLDRPEEGGAITTHGGP
jgi:hypothetical protein